MAEPQQRLAPWILLAVPVLLPFGRLSELPLLIAAALGLIDFLRRRIDLRDAAPRMASLLFLAYWLPELISAPDSHAPQKTWREVAVDLRYLPFLWFCAPTLGAPAAQRKLLSGMAALMALWLVDAGMQAASGWSIGGAMSADRLSGMFGADDLKLGGVLACLSPFLMCALWAAPWWWRLAAVAALITIVLLAGARAAWVNLALLLAALAWSQWRSWRRLGIATLLLGLTATTIGGIAYRVSERFAARIERTQAALTTDFRGLDHALAGRLTIWRTSLDIIEAHPLNGVGARAFRMAYPQFAAADDPWLRDPGGALHAHQWVLEVLAETGVLGLLCWIGAIALMIDRWRRAPPTARAAAWPAGLALAVCLFPFNTHYALYSSVWGGLIIWLMGVYAGAISSRGAPATAQS